MEKGQDLLLLRKRGGDYTFRWKRAVVHSKEENKCLCVVTMGRLAQGAKAVYTDYMVHTAKAGLVHSS